MSEQRRYRIEEIIPAQGPAIRLKSSEWSTCQLVGSKVFVAGDLGRGGATLAVFDLQTNRWSVLDELTHGEASPPRRDLISFIFNDRLYLHSGGSFIRGFIPVLQSRHSLFILDLVTLERTRTKKSREILLQRFGHSGQYLERLRKFVIFVGLPLCDDEYSEIYAFSVESHEWNMVKAKGESPKVRLNHSSCAVGERIYIYGGDADGFVDDLLVLDCRQSTFVWSKANVGLGVFRSWASLTYWKGEFFIFGGRDDYEDHSELFVLQPPGYYPVKAVPDKSGVDPMSYEGYGYTVLATATDAYIFNGSRESFNPLKLTML